MTISYLTTFGRERIFPHSHFDAPRPTPTAELVSCGIEHINGGSVWWGVWKVTSFDPQPVDFLADDLISSLMPSRIPLAAHN